MIEKQPEYLFVYGTLLAGLRNHHHLKNAQYLGPASVQGALFELGDYPGLILAGHLAMPMGPVLGELYKVEASNWAQLDALEAFDPNAIESSMYLRQFADVTWFKGTETVMLQAQTYVYNWPLEGRRRIENGDFRRHLSNKSA